MTPTHHLSSENVNDDTQMKAQQPNQGPHGGVSGFIDQEMASYHGSSSKKVSSAPEDKENSNINSNSGKQKNKSNPNRSVIRLI
jgi:hypothetical protein